MSLKECPEPATRTRRSSGAGASDCLRDLLDRAWHLDRRRTAALIARPVAPRRGGNGVARLAHQMTEPEPTPSPGSRADRGRRDSRSRAHNQGGRVARGRCRRRGPAARALSGRARSGRRWRCCWRAGACVRRCRRARPSRPGGFRTIVRTACTCRAWSCRRSCASRPPPAVWRARTTCSWPCPRADWAR